MATDMSFGLSLRSCAVLVLPFFLTDCADVNHRLTEFDPKRAADTGHFSRTGHVYCILGWTGIWSQGMEVIASRAKGELDVDTASLPSDEWRQLARYIEGEHTASRLSGPLVLVGHSLGADNVIILARALNRAGVAIDLLVLIDPNLPPHIPSNVRRCVNIFKSNDAVPPFSGTRVIADSPRSTIENIDLRFAAVGFDVSGISHFNISQVKGVQEMVLAEIARSCPRQS